MKQAKLSATKRLGKPLLFGTLLLGLSTAFIYRHLFFEDVDVLRAQQQATYDAKRLAVMEERQRLMAKLQEKKPETQQD